MHARWPQGEHLHTLEAGLTARPADRAVRDAWRPTLARAPAAPGVEAIDGIGRSTGKLAEANIQTLEALAALTPEEVTAIMALPRWRWIDAPGWVRQAQELAAKRSAEPQP
jgi:predicted flap endonuclease-1-like 5' DNA nuclease